MIKIRYFLAPALLLGALHAVTGCISTHHKVFSDAPRTKVSFATDRAGHLFYEALSRTPSSRQRTEKRTEVNLILIDVDHRVVSGPNSVFNDAVAFCDTNQDGEITEDEATIFAGAWPRSKS
jgi:hypothetical protein